MATDFPVPGTESRPATRERVYSAIDTEREYQNLAWPAPENQSPRQQVGEYIVCLDTYVQTMKQEWTHNRGDLAALEVMRKVAGIAVRCMEEHGAPLRLPKVTATPAGTPLPSSL